MRKSQYILLLLSLFMRVSAQDDSTYEQEIYSFDSPTSNFHYNEMGELVNEDVYWKIYPSKQISETFPNLQFVDSFLSIENSNNNNKTLKIQTAFNNRSVHFLELIPTIKNHSDYSFQQLYFNDVLKDISIWIYSEDIEIDVKIILANDQMEEFLIPLEVAERKHNGWYKYSLKDSDAYRIFRSFIKLEIFYSVEMEANTIYTIYLDNFVGTFGKPKPFTETIFDW